MKRSTKIALLVMTTGSLGYLTYRFQPTTLTDPDGMTQDRPAPTSPPTPPPPPAPPPTQEVEVAGETPAQAAVGAVTPAGNNYTSHVYMHHLWWHQTYGSPYIGGSYSGSNYVPRSTPSPRAAPPAPSQAAHAAPSSRGGFGSSGSGGSS